MAQSRGRGAGSGIGTKVDSTFQPVFGSEENWDMTFPTKVKVVGTFPVPFTEFLGESRSRGRHTECACYFCQIRRTSIDSTDRFLTLEVVSKLFF